MPVDMAVNSPRIHWENNVLNVEPGFDVQPELITGDRTILWNQQNMFFGGVHTAMEFAGVITGAGDRRRNGAIAYL